MRILIEEETRTPSPTCLIDNWSSQDAGRLSARKIRATRAGNINLLVAPLITLKEDYRENRLVRDVQWQSWTSCNRRTVECQPMHNSLLRPMRCHITRMVAICFIWCSWLWQHSTYLLLRWGKYIQQQNNILQSKSCTRVVLSFLIA